MNLSPTIKGVVGLICWHTNATQFEWAKNSRDSHRVFTRTLGQLIICDDSWRRAHRTLANKESPKVYLISRNGKELRGLPEWKEESKARSEERSDSIMFPVLDSSSWCFPKMGFLGLASSSLGFPDHLRENSTNEKRDQVWSCTYLGTLSHQSVPMSFPEFTLSVPVPFCQSILTPWAFSHIHL